MYCSAREWGIQPSEFWEMTIGEWLVEAAQQYEKSELGQKERKKQILLEDASLSAEEWMSKYGFA